MSETYPAFREAFHRIIPEPLDRLEIVTAAQGEWKGRALQGIAAGKYFSLMLVENFADFETSPETQAAAGRDVGCQVEVALGRFDVKKTLARDYPKGENS